jgi:SAM-dependent methyltransferase
LDPGFCVNNVALPMTMKLGGYEVPEDWPIKGEAGRTFAEKLRNGFFSAYMAGDVIIDVGFRGGHDDAVPILPHAIGVDLDFPGYDGTTLPFADESVDTVYSSHMLEHVPDYRAVIRDWHRVLRSDGFIVCVVPHQFLYEKKRNRPSLWNADHKRFYTPATLLCEFEASLQPNTYRVRHLRDNDENYTYHIGPEAHAGGAYEIEVVVQKIEKPRWNLSGDSDVFCTDFAAMRDEVAFVAAERDQFALESARWFDAAIVAPAEQILRYWPSRFRRGLRAFTRHFSTASSLLPSLGGQPGGAAKTEADRARDSGRWERAARFYLDALERDAGDPTIWVELGRALKQAGKDLEAQLAHRMAAELDRSSRR